ncbi:MULTISPECIES: substrate-binding and VWA domain-containing protein [unclassified Streptomyces]|uniref:substrate-binding and VWA domain-containing protein n=1 Tax=unclassified Streptomyces TaxID=2593676 RepID=UPI002252BC05|nr:MULTISPECIES: substrate-binding and VWA domain-containing protein [unclassified Streptomyces]MCX5138862.1 substrate-binding and VWA domain-containing protein [Streptomyces sp. NBC_00338]WRZ63571.1 substrate-binding and VWA domain-containing protein [Streptomyces sp. NBC_01257]WSU57536.1 substrate-binding and VWA domain-containing protein [Streptomyces sp. NBC_01104]
MGRHSLPDDYAADGSGDRPPRRRRTVAIATMLVLAVAAGTAVAAQGGLLSFSKSCEDTAVHLTMMTSPDIAPAVRAVADKARKDDLRSDGHCVDVDVVARDSYKVADALARGTRPPDYQMWLPDSDLWLNRAKGNGDAVPITPGDSVATSPVTLAMVPSAAKTLGWPEKQYSWAELTAAAMESDKVRLGSADPARSATGLLALTSIGISSDKLGGDSDTRAAATAKLLAQRMSDGDTQVVETLPQDSSGAEQGNPSRNQAVLLSEQAAFAHNAESTDGGKLDLFYPKDGTPLLNYPFTLVNEEEQTTDESRAALRFMTLLSEDASQRTLQEHGFRTVEGTADETLTASAGAKSPQPYETSPGTPPSDEVLQETLGMWTITVQSARLTTVVDASGSMATIVPGRNQSRMDVTKASLIQALNQFTPNDEIGLWEFATTLDGEKDYRSLVATARLGDPAKGGGTHREKLAAAFAALKPVPDGATGLYDTALAAYKEAQRTYVKGKFNAVVILTDGSNQDERSISRSALIAELKKIADPERPVPLLAIAVGPDADRDEVNEIAKVTGGGGYQVNDPAEIQAVILQAVMTAGQSGRAGEE